MRLFLIAMLFLSTGVLASFAEDDGPDLIFKKTTVWKFLSPDHKLATYALDDPIVSDVACHFTIPEKGGWTGWLGLAEELSMPLWPAARLARSNSRKNLSRAMRCSVSGVRSFSRRCRSYAAAMLERRISNRNKRNVPVYLVYTDKLIEGSPENSTSTVPIIRWGGAEPQRCGDWLKE